jgi:hypothetical protein
MSTFLVSKTQRGLPTYPATPIHQTFTQYPLSKVVNHVGVGPSQGTAQKNTFKEASIPTTKHKKVGLQNSSLKITRTACLLAERTSYSCRI